MTSVLSISPLIASFPNPAEVTPELLNISGIAVSTEHMAWLLEKLQYFVENPAPAPTASVLEAGRLYTNCKDKMYLLRVYKLADFLCLPEGVLNSIALAIFECFFLTNKWSTELLNHYPLEQRLRALWRTFVDDVVLCLHNQNDFTDDVDYWSETMHVQHGSAVQLQLDDIQDVFGKKARKLVEHVRAKESLQTFDLSHYIFEHEHTYTLKDVLSTFHKLCVVKTPHWWLGSTTFTVSWMHKHLGTVKQQHQARMDYLAIAATLGHDTTTCSCADCLHTHHGHCQCRHHRDPEPEYDDYDDYVEPDWETRAEMAWERNYGGW
jgi:hypothetical protein